MDERKYLFEEAPISKAIVKMAVPTMISMLVVIVYNIADTFFIGQTNDPLKVSAVSLAAPIFMLYTAIGNLFNVGGSSEISRSLGAQKEERVKHISSFCFYSMLVIGVVVVILSLLGVDIILRLLGATDSTWEFTKQYVIVISIGTPCIILSCALGGIIRSVGASRQAMTGNMIGTITNIILDPVFILGLGWGVTGAAVATVIGNLFAVIYYLYYILRKQTIISVKPQDFSCKNDIAKNVFFIGTPTMLNTLLVSVSNIVRNNMLTQYGDVCVAAMGVASKVDMVVSMVLTGLGAGIQPLIGYSYGAGNKRRLRKTFRTTAIYTVVLGTILTLITAVLRTPLIRMFINNDEVVEYGIKMVTAFLFAAPVIGLYILSTNVIQAMGKVKEGFILSICRQGILFIPAICLLNSLWGLDGIIYAQPVVDYVSTAISLLLVFGLLKKFDTSNTCRMESGA